MHNLHGKWTHQNSILIRHFTILLSAILLFRREQQQQPTQQKILFRGKSGG